METNGHYKVENKLVSASPPRTPSQLVGEIVLIKRRRLKWTQGELADFANKAGKTALTQVKISAIENGAEPTWFEILAICKAMQCNLMEFDV